MEDRFGLPASVFDGYLLLRRGNSWWLFRESPHLRLVARFKVGMVGLRAFQKVGRYVKPSTRMIQMFGRAATKGTCALEEGEFLRLSAGDTVESDTDLENGYIILCFKGHILGLGLLIGGKIHSQIPRKEVRFLFRKFKN